MRRSVQLAWLILSFSFLSAGCRDKPASPNASASAAPAGSVAPERLRFTPAPSPIGEKFRVERTSRLKVEVEFWAENERWGTSETMRNEEIAANVEVLGLVGASPAKARIRYERYRLEEDEPDKPPRRDAHLEGHTYVVDATSTPANVTDDSGKAASEPEETSVRSHFPSLGKDDPVIEALSAYRVEVAKPMTLGEKLFRGLLGSTAGDYEPGRFTVTRLTKQGGTDVALIEWSGKLVTKEDNGMVTDWHIKGKTHVAVRPARVLSNEVRADMDVSGKARKEGVWVKMEGDGSLVDDYKVKLTE